MKKRTGRKTRKTKKSARSTPARARKTKVRVSAKSRAVRKPTLKRAAAKRKKASTKKMRAPKSTARRAPKEVLGEGNYTAAREFRRDETTFVRRNKKRIAGLGQAAQAALDGDERQSLDDAAAEAASHSRAPGEDF